MNTLRFNLFKNVSGGAALLTAFVSCLVLLGWELRIEVLKSFLPHSPRMNPLTAITLILASVSLWLLHSEGKGKRALRIGRVLTFGVVLIGLLRLIGGLLGWNPNIDQFLFRQSLASANNGIPSRMAAGAALDLVLMGVALLLLDAQVRHSRLASQILALLAGSIAIFVATAYSYGVRELIGVTFLLPVSMPGALSLLALSAGILAARPNEGIVALCTGPSTSGIVARRLLPAAVAIPLVVGWVRILGQRAGWFSAEIGTALSATAYIVILTTIVLWTAHLLHQTDAKREHAEHALRSSEERYHLLFESNPHPVWVFDLENLTVLDVNSAALHSYGYSREEFLALTIKDIRPAEDVCEALESLSKAPSDSVIQGTWRHRKKDGTIIEVEVISHPLLYAGKQARLVVATDITERKRAEREILVRSAQLEAANKELEAFSYSVSHDLRAPLRSIDGFSQALLEDYDRVLDNAGKNYLGRVRAATQRMGALIDDLLNLSRVTRSEMHREKLNLSLLARSVAEELRKAEPDRQVEIQVEEGLVAEGDSRLLRIVLENLLGNAWKFTSKHERARIEFGKLQRNGTRAFFVRDDGAGFDPAYSTRLFGAFQRLHAVTEFPGTGVGLATVQRIIHRHGGRLWAEGEIEKGATFGFTL
jgi:PAS domain S-box-containing protein